MARFLCHLLSGTKVSGFLLRNNTNGSFSLVSPPYSISSLPSTRLFSPFVTTSASVQPESTFDRSNPLITAAASTSVASSSLTTNSPTSIPYSSPTPVVVPTKDDEYYVLKVPTKANDDTRNGNSDGGSRFFSSTGGTAVILVVVFTVILLTVLFALLFAWRRKNRCDESGFKAARSSFSRPPPTYIQENEGWRDMDPPEDEQEEKNVRSEERLRVELKRVSFAEREEEESEI